MALVPILGSVILICGVIIQILLSKSKKRYFGYILPALNFAGSLMMQLTIYVNRVADVPNPPYYELQMFLGQNAITVLLLIIHFMILKWKKKQAELKKMNIQDF